MVAGNSAVLFVLLTEENQIQNPICKLFLFFFVLFSKGITSTSLTEDTISVLGNMCCTLDGSYIENSDPSILEKLKNCPDLTNDQTTAVETLLLSGKTQYGYVDSRSNTSIFSFFRVIFIVCRLQYQQIYFVALLSSKISYFLLFLAKKRSKLKTIKKTK